MTDRPILFSSPMIKALLAGTKTQTRRILKPQPAPGDFRNTTPETARWFHDPKRGGMWIADGVAVGPFRSAAPSDRLWVRETFSGEHRNTGTPPRDWPMGEVWFWADGNPDDGDWTKPKPGMHMPRWCSRLTLIVTEVHVERLQDISEADALAEGVPLVMEGSVGDQIYCAKCDGFGVHAALAANLGVTKVECSACVTAKQRYASLWNHINGAGAWDANPWVVAVTFAVHRRNIDAAE